MKGDVAKFVREKLGHEPNDIRLFELALTHASAASNNYERLEFLGDRVLGHAIARALYDRHPQEPEGYLSRRYNVLVARETCAEIGRELGVPSLVRLGKQAREDGASQSENVVGDVVEALIGALLIDGGVDAAQQFVARIWEPLLAEQRKAPKHPKSALQELAAARECKPPLYEVIGRTGAHHAPRFTIRVTVPGIGEATAEGASKQEAETEAAEALLNKVQQ
ncbi:MAG TPA: ribonuclease III [Sphingomicrobium sp.]|nr:ribonuclease III [Sphingomicrobium sp.]